MTRNKNTKAWVRQLPEVVDFSVQLEQVIPSLRLVIEKAVLQFPTVSYSNQKLHLVELVVVQMSSEHFPFELVGDLKFGFRELGFCH